MIESIVVKEHVDFGAANFRKYTDDIEKGKLKVLIDIMIKVKIPGLKVLLNKLVGVKRYFN